MALFKKATKLGTLVLILGFSFGVSYAQANSVDTQHNITFLDSINGVANGWNSAFSSFSDTDTCETQMYKATYPNIGTGSIPISSAPCSQGINGGLHPHDGESLNTIITNFELFTKEVSDYWMRITDITTNTNKYVLLHYDGTEWSTSSASTCSDGMQNQDETGIDTGGVCGNSNVLFLPGLEASRLYMPRSDNSEDQLWESNGLSDIEDLYLDNDGTSINQNIYTRDIIKETNTPIPAGSLGQNIYKSFAATMDELVADQKINGWKEYAYDWRQDINDIINNGTKYESGSLSLTDTLQFLADTSKNEKVTIVAHSNGGLLAKALLKKLQDDKIAGTNNLIDHVDVLILVAVPEIGTASAVPAIMHGYNQRMGLGWILDEVHARELGRNMLGAYGLLPSKEYINHVSASPVTFVDTVIPSNITTSMLQTFGSAISSHDEYKSFLFGGEGRTNPPINQINLPISLPESLFAKAENLHNSIDAWTPPASLRVIEVAGWGLETVAGFEYYPKCEVSTSLGCNFVMDQRPNFTSDGDGTVVVLSAHYMNFLGSAEKYWVDLNKYNDDNVDLFGKEHKNILEIDSLIEFISNKIQNINQPSYNYLSTTTPVDTSGRLRLSIHSPTTLDAYDTEGNHTGKICPPGSDFCYAEENIVNSSYLEFGEGKYINLPEDQFAKVKLQGTGTGTFTYESEKVSPNGTSTTTTFKDIAITSATEAEITRDSATGNLKLSLDKNGDGAAEIILQVAPGSTATLPTYIFSGFLQPINDTAHQTGDNLSVFKAGSTVPVKFQLKNVNGAIIQASTLPVWLIPQRGTQMNAPIDEAVYTTTGTNGNTFRWDSVSQQYIYNWSTKGLAPGYWYKISVKLDDGNTYSVKIGLR